MPTNELTAEELRDQIAFLETRIAHPDVPPARKDAYRATIRKIEAQIAVLQGVGEPQAASRPAAESPAPQAQPPAEKPQEQQRPQSPAPPRQEVPAPARQPSAPERPASPQKPAQAPTTRNKPVAPAPVEQRAPVELIVQDAVPGGPAKVEITWPYSERPQSFTEGDCATNFRQSFHELLGFDYVKQGRWHDVPRYRSFYKAAVYYRALCEMWKREYLEPKEIKGVTVADKGPTATLWDMIVDNAQTVAKIQTA